MSGAVPQTRVPSVGTWQVRGGKEWVDGVGEDIETPRGVPAMGCLPLRRWRRQQPQQRHKQRNGKETVATGGCIRGEQRTNGAASPAPPSSSSVESLVMVRVQKPAMSPKASLSSVLNAHCFDSDSADTEGSCTPCASEAGAATADWEAIDGQVDDVDSDDDDTLSVASTVYFPAQERCDAHLVAEVNDIVTMYKTTFLVSDICQRLRSLLSWDDEHNEYIKGLFADRDVDVDYVLETEARLLRCINDSNVDNTWFTLANEKFKLYHKHTPGSSVHSVKFVCELDTPPEHILALINEVDLVKKWNSYVLGSDKLSQKSTSDLNAFLSFWFPWPLHHRDCYIKAIGADMLRQHGCIAVSIESYDDLEVAEHERQRTSTPASRMSWLPGTGLILKPLPPSKPGGHRRTLATVTIHCDSRMPSVPNPLLHFALKFMMPFMYHTAIKGLSKNFENKGSYLMRRMEEKKDFYAAVEHTIDTSLAARA